MTQLVLFDLYGMLLRLARDTQTLIKVARLGNGPIFSVARELALTTTMHSVADFAARLGIADLAAQQVAEYERDLRLDLASAELFAGTEPTLRELRRRGCHLAVNSNLTTPYQQPYFELRRVASAPHGRFRRMQNELLGWPRRSRVWVPKAQEVRDCTVRHRETRGGSG